MDSKTIKYFNDKNVETMKKSIEDYELDNKKKKRIKECMCKYCTYINNKMIVMDAFFTTTCDICGKEVVSANSNVDKICLDCAKKNNLCKHCKSILD